MSSLPTEEVECGGRRDTEKGVWESEAPLPRILNQVSGHLCSSPEALSDRPALGLLTGQPQKPSANSPASEHVCSGDPKTPHVKRYAMAELCPLKKNMLKSHSTSGWRWGLYRVHQGKMSSLAGGLLQYNRHPYKKRKLGHRDRPPQGHGVKTQGGCYLQLRSA